MNTSELLSNLHRQGFTLTPLPGGKLEVKPASKLPEELREQLRQRKVEVLALLTVQQQSAPPPDYRTLYRQMAEAVCNDCFLIDPHWLIDSHPELWEQITMLDEELSQLEQQGARALCTKLPWYVSWLACGRSGLAMSVSGARRRGYSDE